MDDLINDFEKFKISAFSKVKLINDQIKEVTIGPQTTAKTTKIVEEKKVTPRRRHVPVRARSRSPSPKILTIKKVIAQLEKERQGQVKHAINERVCKLEEFSKAQDSQMKQEWIKRQQKLVQNMQSQEQLILKTMELYDQNSTQEHQKRLQYYQDLAERQRQNEEKIQASERRKQLLNSLIDTIKGHQIEFRTVYQEIATIVKTCGNEILKSMSPEFLRQLKSLAESMDETIAGCKLERISEEEAKRARDLVAQLKELKERISAFVKSAQQEAAEKAEARIQEKIQEQQEKEKTNTNVAMLASEQETVEPPLSNSGFIFDQYVSKSNFKTYCEVQQFLDDYKARFKELEADNGLKQYKSDLKKAVNIPVNAISAATLHHLTDKYKKLQDLLSGKPVLLGDNRIDLLKHPQAVAFCTDLLAKKFVLQGDLMVSNKPEIAFLYGAVIVALWNDFPDFGKLLLAYFYKDCPYLVPWYVPRSTGEPNEEYFINQGYKYTDGVIEKQDKFLKRMTGIMRLYSAIFVTKAKRGQTGNPHGMKEAWRWFASILNLEPRIDITATVIHVFLENVGFCMIGTYGKMFRKVMKFLVEKYLPVLSKNDSGGPVTRLMVLLEEYKKRGDFEVPSGVLPNNFW